MMGSVTFPAIDLPTSPEVKTLFRLWGLTLGMTREIIEFTQLDHNRLAFLQLAKSKPIFSRPDIGWLTTLIASITFTIKNKTAAVHKSRYVLYYVKNKMFTECYIYQYAVTRRCGTKFISTLSERELWLQSW